MYSAKDTKNTIQWSSECSWWLKNSYSDTWISYAVSDMKKISYEKFKFDVFPSKSIHVGLSALRLKAVIGCFSGTVTI